MIALEDNAMEYTDIKRIALSIRFKEYLLGRDVQSRRVILETCISYLEKYPDETVAISWFNNLVAINNEIDRKKRIRHDACWEELHLVISKSQEVRFVMSLWV